ncbi:MAG TPA: hypothetical protein VLB86_05325 [Gaiellaceae bacterium]|nr:hypothetical protein [Gaiellaceae bacterium]
MPARFLPVLLVLGALAADAAGRPELAFVLLVASVPAAAVSALELFGRLVELPRGAAGVMVTRIEAFLGGLGLVLVVVAAAARGQSADASTLPALAASAAVAAIAVYCAQTLSALLRPDWSRR